MTFNEGTGDTADALRGALLGGSDSWDGAQQLPTMTKASGTWNSAVESMGSLELESSFLMREGREPTNDEIMEYLEKNQLQVFMTDVIMDVAKHLPPDPFDFLLDNIEAMVMKYRAKNGGGSSQPLTSKLGSKLILPLGQPPPPHVPPEQLAKVVRQVATLLQSEGMARASADKLFDKFASASDKLAEEGFAALLAHLEAAWGLQPEDTKLVTEVLKRWRFRANSARGTRGHPLWPLLREDFATAYPSVLRSLRDRYVPIGGRVHRSLFIRQGAGKMEDRYLPGPKLGAGAYGEVTLVTLKSSKEKRVCKRIGKRQARASAEEMISEVDLLRGLDHPHITRLFEYYEADDCLEIIMEPVFGGTLSHLVQGLHTKEDGDPLSARPEALTEPWVAKALSQLLSALTYAHEVAGVIHKDLKCDNVLLVGKPKVSAQQQLKAPIHVMLADFGIAELFSPSTPVGFDGQTTEGPTGTGSLGSFEGSPLHRSPTARGRRSERVGGTPSYMSPEMFKGSFTEKCDMWSLGVMVFQLMTGELPYKGENLLMQAHAVCNPRRHPKWELLERYRWSLGARWFCQQLLSKEEGMRPTAAEAMRDNWLTKLSADHTEVLATDEERHALQGQHLQSHMMKMAMHCITSQLNVSQVHHLNLRFHRYDSSNDGRLSHVEMRQVLADVGVTTPEDIELIIESLDSDHSGMIEYSEFVAGCLSLSGDGMKEQIRVTFDIFDLDGNGSISFKELCQVLVQGANTEAPSTRPCTPMDAGKADGTAKAAGAGVGTLLPDGKTAEEVMKDLDRDSSNKVEYAEFEAYLLGEHQRAGEKLQAKSAP